MTNPYPARKSRGGGGFRSTYILVAVLVVLLFGFGLTQFLGLRKPGELDDFVLPSLHKNNITRAPRDFDVVVIERSQPAEKLVFTRHDQGWRLAEPYAVLADNPSVDRLINQVVSARKEKSDLTTNLADYDLDPESAEHKPHAVVRLKEGADKEWVFHVGKKSPGSDPSAVVYVTSSDRPKKPMAVKRAELDNLFKDVKDFLPLNLLNASALNTSYVSLQRPKEAPVVLDKSSDGRWVFVQPAYGQADFDGAADPAGPEPKPISGVKDLLEAIGALQLASPSDFLTLSATDKELENFGLAKGAPATLRIEIKRVSENLIGGSGKPMSLGLLIGKKIESKDEKKIESKDEKKVESKDEKKAAAVERYYACRENERAVMQVPALSIAPILKVAEDPAVLRNRDLVPLVAARIDAVNVKNAAGSFKLRRDNATGMWQLFQGSTPPRLADATAIQDLLKALTERRLIKDFPEKKSEAGLGFDQADAVVVSLWENGTQKEEKKEAEPKLKDAKPTVTLTFGKKEKDLVYVKRQTRGSQGADKPIVAAVPASLLAAAGQGPLDYLDRALPRFEDNANVVKLVVERAGVAYEVVKEPVKTPAVWQLRRPPDRAGLTADTRTVEGILIELRKLRANKLVVEKAGDLAQFGLDPPQVRVILTISNEGQKPEERAYLFGKEADGELYAKQGERDLVFLVSPLVLQTLQSDFQDPTVFRFDSARVKEVKLSGWKQAGGKSTLVLEHVSAKNWKAKEPPGFELDVEQADAFVAGLAKLTAQSFVLRKLFPREPHQLDDQRRSLHIEIAVEGEKTPFTLTIGALDAAAKGYYAQSNTLPGDVFLLPQSRFEKILNDGPDYFRKKSAGK